MSEQRIGSYPFTAYVIELGSMPHYWCGKVGGQDDWCNNINHARKFRTEAAAFKAYKNIKAYGTLRVAGHVWLEGGGVT